MFIRHPEILARLFDEIYAFSRFFPLLIVILSWPIPADRSFNLRLICEGSRGIYAYRILDLPDISKLVDSLPQKRVCSKLT
jgi:hypothetical protein